MSIQDIGKEKNKSKPYCKECGRLKEGIYAIVAELVNKNPETALTLARTTMYGGSVNNPLDCERLGRKPNRNGERKNS